MYYVAATDDAPVESHDTAVQDLYTVEDVVERMGFGWYQLGITLFSGSLWVSKVTVLFAYINHKRYIGHVSLSWPDLFTQGIIN